MIPYETDPTLHDHEPPRAFLDDGFSPPASDQPLEVEQLPPCDADSAPGVRTS